MQKEYSMIINAYTKMELYKEAISALEFIRANKQQLESNLLSMLAECYFKTNDLTKAAEEYLRGNITASIRRKYETKVLIFCASKSFFDSC